MTLSGRPSVGWLVDRLVGLFLSGCHDILKGREVPLPSSYRSTSLLPHNTFFSIPFVRPVTPEALIRTAVFTGLGLNCSHTGCPLLATYNIHIFLFNAKSAPCLINIDPFLSNCLILVKRRSVCVDLASILMQLA